MKLRLRKFTSDRNWDKFHNPKDLAILISLQASEILRISQWSGVDLPEVGKLEKIREELADVMMYCIILADVVGIDPKTIILDKLKINEANILWKRSMENRTNTRIFCLRLILHSICPLCYQEPDTIHFPY